MGIRAMAWRLAGIGLAASLAGLVLGYGVTRGLRRSIHQLRVRVQDAADKLGYDLPPVVWNDGGGLDDLQVRMQSVVRQIESVVQSLQQRERELLRAEQLAAVGQLAAGVAHEVRNPLTSIKMLVQAGGESGAAGLAGEDLAVVEREIRRIERSLQTFLDFARPPRLERKPHDLNPLIERMLDLIRGRAHKQRIALDYRPPAAPIVGDVDAEQLHQVLINLALNALDVMPHGGRLHVGLERSADGAAEIALSDTGPGIADTLLPRLFEPFVSGKETGLGLGLVVSRRIVEDHGGTLRGGNRREGGARFAIRLPAAAPARAAS